MRKYVKVKKINGSIWWSHVAGAGWPNAITDFVNRMSIYNGQEDNFIFA